MGFTRSKLYAALFGAAVMTAGALPAFAVVDTGDITDAIASAGTAGAAVGSAVVVMIVAIKVFKWLRRAL